MISKHPARRGVGPPDAPPDPFTRADALELRGLLERTSEAPPGEFLDIVPLSYATGILQNLEKKLKAEPTLLQVDPAEGARVTVVGDTHGQFHDVLKMMSMMGDPSAENVYVFNGDYVDRGAWGLETLLLLAAWKLAEPSAVHLLRGNHETTLCAMVYGFKGELVAKTGQKGWKTAFSACKKAFAALPLAARIGRRTLVLHGGLFRKPRQRGGRGGGGKGRARAPKRRKASAGSAPGDPEGEIEADDGVDGAGSGDDGAPPWLGTLEDLAAASKGGLDPSGSGSSFLATDVLWSDPVREPGMEPNLCRNVGVVFGPDVTERFLRTNGLRLVLRSHEGPDARDGRTDMAPMLEGYTLDHETPAGNLMTVFSAPDYPQFVHETAERLRNRAAVAVLEGPGYDRPTLHQYSAAPRPAAFPFYDLGVPDSDEELEPVGSEVSGMTDAKEEAAERASAEEDDASSLQPGG